MMTLFAIFFLVVFVFCASLLAYIYVGYPLIIVGLARVFKHPVQKKAILPFVTIVIPTFNEEVVIKDTLESMLRLDYPRDRIQILVCDDVSEDRTVEVVRMFMAKGIGLSQGAIRSGKVGGLNRALELAVGEIFVIADADLLPDQNVLRELVANFADESVGCVLAKTQMSRSEAGTSESSGLYWRYEARIRQSESDIHSTVAATGFMALRRKLMQPIPSDIILDDFYLAMMTIRQGYRVIWEPNAVVGIRPNTMSDEVKRRSRMTAGRYQVISISKGYLPYLPPLLRFEVISHKFLRLAIPYLMIIALLSNILFAISLPVSQPTQPSFWILLMDIFLLAQAFFYGLAIAGKYFFNKSMKKSKMMKILTLPYYLCATNFAGFAGLARFVSGKQTVLWQQASRR
jgi:cellulose synthase/poly-beta-1,6-N-acetylglucosamine synthase-like glycosyltransferase